MSKKSMVELRYEGGADLTFHDGSGSRVKVARGQVFETDEETAEILLATDPKVVKANPSYGELQAEAKELGLPATGPKEELAEAVAEAKAETPAVAETETPTAALAPAEAEAPSGPGAITLDELPEGAKISGKSKAKG